MLVTARLRATLRRQTPDGMVDTLTADLDDGAVVADLLQKLEITADPNALMIVINRRAVGPAHPLRPGDEVLIFPALSGGMSDDWLAQLRQLHDADKAKIEAEAAQQAQLEQQAEAERDQALALLRDSHAHELLRQVQKTLLDGGGTLTIYDKARKFDRAILLAWQGTFSTARRPLPKNNEPVQYILVGVREGQLWVNEQVVSPPTPAALKAALLDASKTPATQKKKK